MPVARQLAALAASALALSACVEEDSTTSMMGNLYLTCPPDASCSCEVTGNCFMDCPGGGCDLACTGTSNCFFSCGGPGACTIACENTGNCEATCAGGDCAMTCSGMNNGMMSGAGCTATRTAGMGNCVASP